MALSRGELKKNIIVLTSTYPRWVNDNMPAFVAYLCSELSEEYEVHVLAPHYKGARAIEKMNGVKIYRFFYMIPAFEKLAYGGGVMENLKKNKLLYFVVPFFLLSQTLYLMFLTVRFKYSVLHAHWLIPQGVIAVFLRQLWNKRIPVVVTSHGGDLFALNGTSISGVKKWVLQHSDHISVVSNVMKSKCESMGVSKDKISVLPMGVDLLDQFIPGLEGGSSASLVYVGRLVEKKGVRFLIEAMAILVKKYPYLHLTIVGDGPERDELLHLRHTLLLHDNITFLGSLINSDLPVVLRKSSIAVVPSIVAKSGDQEGLGLVTVEAMGAGCAVVASELPAIRDVINDGETGLLVKPEDAGDLADKIATLIEDADLRSRLSAAGREFVLQKFDWAMVGQNYRQLLRTVQER